MDSVGGNFLPGGSSIADAFVTSTYAFTREWSAQVFGQYESFLISSYLAGSQSNGSARLQLTWTPRPTVSVSR